MLQEVLGDREDVIFSLFPDLNHILHTRERMAIPGEYLQICHVDFKVLKEILDWIEVK